MYISMTISFAVSVILIPIIIFLCNKYSLFDYSDSRKIHTGNIPRLGSIGFVTAFVVSNLYYALTTESVSVQSILPVMIGGLIIFIFGLVDDVKNMRGIVKLMVQAVAALVMICSGYRFSNILGLKNEIFCYAVTFCWIIGVINAFNLIDGFDGLCGGLSFIAAAALAYITKVFSPFISMMFRNLAAGLLGFLIFNKPKAKIFMGDGGSQFLGFVFASLPLLKMTGPFEEQKFPAMIIICAVPLFDVVAAMWRRLREKRSFFSADRAHLHHKMMNLGYRTWGILIILYFIQGLLCGSVILAVKSQRELIAYLIYVLAFSFAAAFFSVIHFANRTLQKAKGEYVSWAQARHKDEGEEVK